MNWKLNLGGEPALIINLVASVLALLVTFQWDGLSEENAAAIVAALFAGANVLAALAVRPVGPAAFTALVGALVALVGTYGFNVSAEAVSAIDGIIVTALALIFRDQVTPTPHQADFTRVA